MDFQNQRNYLIEELITWKDYEIQMAGFNRIGTGKFSKSITVKTREGSKSNPQGCSNSNLSTIFIYNDFCIFLLVPEAAPTQVRGEAVNSTTIRVWWKPPDPQLINGINQGYKLQAWRGNLQQQ